MPDPLSADVVTRLKSDPTAALAAALILAASFPDLVSWAMRAFGGHSPRSSAAFKDVTRAGEVKGNGAGCRAVSRQVGAKLLSQAAAGRSFCRAKNDGAKKHARAKGADTSREAAAKHDEALLEPMRANPEARTTEIIRLNGRPRNSTVLSLGRLEKAGLVEHAGRGKWTVVDPGLLEATTAKPAGWISPLSGQRVARHAADGRVRDAMTLA